MVRLACHQLSVLVLLDASIQMAASVLQRVQTHHAMLLRRGNRGEAGIKKVEKWMRERRLKWRAASLVTSVYSNMASVVQVLCCILKLTKLY